MVKVLYVAEALTRNSGVASVIMNLIRNITDDIKIDLLTYQNGDEEIIEKLKCYGINIYYVPELGLYSFFKFRNAIDNFFQTHQYDIVHSHFNQIDSIVFQIAKKNGVKNCISHSHNTKLSDSRIKSIRNKMLCFNLPKQATVWAACSKDAGICLYGKKFTNSEKKIIIHNGVDCEKFSFDEQARTEIRSEFNIEETEILIGHVGGFRIQKNHEFLIDVFNELCKRSKKYKLLLVGDGELRPFIEKKVNNLNLKKNVIFAGTRSDIHKIMSGLDLFILPSLYEGLPVVGIEAQAAGLNCVFSSSITLEANLTNVTYINLKDSIETWCDIIESINISRHSDYQEMVIKKGYDIKRECEKVTEFYKRIASEEKV